MLTLRQFHADHLHLRLQSSDGSAPEAVDAAAWLLEELRVAAGYYRYNRVVLEVAGSGELGGPGALQELAVALVDLPLLLETVPQRRVSGELAWLWVMGGRRRIAPGARVRFTMEGASLAGGGSIASVLAGGATGPCVPPELAGLPAVYRDRVGTACRLAGSWLDEEMLRRSGMISPAPATPQRGIGAGQATPPARRSAGS